MRFWEYRWHRLSVFPPSICAIEILPVMVAVPLLDAAMLAELEQRLLSAGIPV
jgi:hypothetical protein